MSNGPPTHLGSLLDAGRGNPIIGTESVQEGGLESPRKKRKRSCQETNLGEAKAPQKEGRTPQKNSDHLHVPKLKNE